MNDDDDSVAQSSRSSGSSGNGSSGNGSGGGWGEAARAAGELQRRRARQDGESTAEEEVKQQQQQQQDGDVVVNDGDGGDGGGEDDESSRQFVRKGFEMVSSKALDIKTSLQSRNSVLNFGVQTIEKLMSPATSFAADKWQTYGDAMLDALDTRIDHWANWMGSLGSSYDHSRQQQPQQAQQHEEERKQEEAEDTNVPMRDDDDIDDDNDNDNDNEHDDHSDHDDNDDAETSENNEQYWRRVNRRFVKSKWFAKVDEILLQNQLMKTITDKVSMRVVRPAEFFYTTATETFLTHGGSADMFLAQLKDAMGSTWDDRLVQPSRAFYATCRAVSSVVGAGRFVGGALQLGRQKFDTLWPTKSDTSAAASDAGPDDDDADEDEHDEEQEEHEEEQEQEQEEEDQNPSGRTMDDRSKYRPGVYYMRSVDENDDEDEQGTNSPSPVDVSRSNHNTSSRDANSGEQELTASHQQQQQEEQQQQAARGRLSEFSELSSRTSQAEDDLMFAMDDDDEDQGGAAANMQRVRELQDRMAEQQRRRLEQLQLEVGSTTSTSTTTTSTAATVAATPATAQSTGVSSSDDDDSTNNQVQLPAMKTVIGKRSRSRSFSVDDEDDYDSMVQPSPHASPATTTSMHRSSSANALSSMLSTVSYGTKYGGPVVQDGSLPADDCGQARHRHRRRRQRRRKSNKHRIQLAKEMQPQVRARLMRSDWYVNVDRVLRANSLIRAMPSESVSPGVLFYDTAVRAFRQHAQSPGDYLMAIQRDMGSAWDRRLVQLANSFFQSATRQERQHQRRQIVEHARNVRHRNSHLEQIEQQQQIQQLLLQRQRQQQQQHQQQSN
eukprot:TRINITY_DN66661_c13_g4_i2.p1 TRINITY_DN66661_c13_g4~~TRINITY_DN66661_c13_g4_i2.p1  ORF type:complete len:835 (+),score=435.05 TRINITY_DN66661_c13_g4_i2:45-2549(+)